MGCASSNTVAKTTAPPKSAPSAEKPSPSGEVSPSEGEQVKVVPESTDLATISLPTDVTSLSQTVRVASEVEPQVVTAIIEAPPSLIDETAASIAAYIAAENISDEKARFLCSKMEEARGRVCRYMEIDPSLYTDVGLQIAAIDKLNLNWEVKVQKGTIKVCTSMVAGSPWMACKAEAVIEADRDELVTLMLNDYRMDEYDDMVAECSIIRQLNDRTVLRRMGSISMWPVTRRDFLSLSLWDELADQSVVLATVDIDDELCPPVKGFVRGKLLSGGYRFLSLDPGPDGRARTLMSMVAHTDLGGAMPISIVNMLVSQTPLKMFSRVSAITGKCSTRSKTKGQALETDTFNQMLLDQLREDRETRLATGAPPHHPPLHPSSSLRSASLRSASIAKEVIVFDSAAASDATGPRDSRYSSRFMDSANEAEGAADGSPKMFCGYMRKEGKIVKSWKSRYFILESGVLSYYEGEFSTVKLGDSINLRGYSMSKPNNPNALQILLSPVAAAGSRGSVAIATSRVTEADIALPAPPPTKGVSNNRLLLLELESEESFNFWWQSLSEHIAFMNQKVVPPVHSGFMRKQGRFIKNWKDRFFVLENGQLSYYDSPAQSKPISSSSSSSASRASCAAGSSSPPSSLKHVGESMMLVNATVSLVPPAGLLVHSKGTKVHPARSLLLEVEEEGKAQEWKRHIEAHIDFLATEGFA